ncbi:MHO_4530 family protein [Mycoplasma seminis]|uniref:Uncharacterized protein n=1 Tax=Mycoplasma seminis TaxID=512749 RepID=A0ABY9HB74_9MOLU|nr:hypothetical protein [Mycoplasma seminis]WLP85852.1 hypothetical protein Q8852_01750 [Mycoplasma seminis]
MPISSIIGVIIGVFVAITLFTFLFILLLYFFYARNSSGIILFKIDSNNNRVIRQSSKNYAFATIFDAQKFKFQQYNYIPLDTFLSILDEESSKYISNYIKEGIIKKQQIAFNFANNIKNSLNLYERLIYFFDKKCGVQNIYHLKIYPLENGEYNCIITWKRKNQTVELLNQEENSFYNAEFKGNTHIIIAFALKPFYITRNIESEYINEVFNQFDLNPKKTPIFKQNGFLFLVVSEKSKHTYLKYLHKAMQINNDISYSKCFIAATIFRNTKLATEYSREMLIAKISYSLFNILNEFKQYKNYINLPLDFINTKEFKEFNSQLIRYRNENSLLNKDLNNMHINYFPIKNYSSSKSSNLTIASVSNDSYDVIDNKWNQFFHKIPILNYEYENYWYDYVTKNSNKNNKNLLVKISQEVYLNKQLDNSENNPICLIYAYNNMFDHLNLKRKIDENFKNAIPTALYINEIDKALINIINDTKLKAIVIGDKVTSHLNNTKIYFDCINVINLASNNNIKVIYENPPVNLDELIILKAKVFACYYTNEDI